MEKIYKSEFCALVEFEDVFEVMCFQTAVSAIFVVKSVYEQISFHRNNSC